MSCDTDLLTVLSTAYSRRDRDAYYRTLAHFGDPYGKLALGVVNQSLISGRTARFFAEFIAGNWGHPLSPALWLQISYQLMISDFEHRFAPQAKDRTDSLYWGTIRDYHVDTFQKFGIPGRAWTAFIPLEIVGVSGAPALWSDMLRRGIIPVGLESVADVLAPIARQAGLTSPTPGLILPPAGAAAPAGILLGTLLADLTHRTVLQRCKNDIEAMRCIARSTEQEDAILWLDGVYHAAAPTMWRTLSATAATNMRGTAHSIERLLGQRTP